MKKSFPLLLLVVLTTLTAIAVAAAAPTKSMGLKATLNTGQEVPKPAVKAPRAKGTFSASLMDDGTVKYKLTFRGLTGAAQAAHIHLARPGKAGPVAVALCGPCTSGQSGSVRVTAAQARKIRSGGAYVNVHTAKNPNGEIRGQLTGR